MGDCGERAIKRLSMENTGLISVIVPVYNVEKYLEECVESVLAQTYTNIEVILVDDGATDSSGQICDRYAEKDDRIRVIHQKNQGLSGARNTGLANAKGEYVYFLDSDDWILPEALQELYVKAKAEDVDVVYFDAFSFADNPEEFEVQQRYIRKHDYPTDTGYIVLEEQQKNKEYHSAVPLLFIKRKFLMDNKFFFVQEILYEDMIFTYQVFCSAEKVAQYKSAFYQRRYRSNSIMTSKKNVYNFKSVRKVYEEVRDFSKKIKKENDDVARTYIARCAFNALNIYKQLSPEEQKVNKQEYQELKADILMNGAFGNKALQVRCYGTVLWFLYKVYSKLRGK